MKFPRVEFLETAPKFRKRKENSSCVYVPNKMSHREIPRCSRAVTAKKCTKKCNARADVVILVIKPIAFLTLSLPSPSSLLKLPNLTSVSSVGELVPRKDELLPYSVVAPRKSSVNSHQISDKKQHGFNNI